MNNEAAERLRRVGYLDHTYVQDKDDPAYGEPLSPLLDEALAAERRATVERIEAAIEVHLAVGKSPDYKRMPAWLRAILEKEAAR